MKAWTRILGPNEYRWIGPTLETRRAMLYMRNTCGPSTTRHLTVGPYTCIAITEDAGTLLCIYRKAAQRQYSADIHVALQGKVFANP